ncbi:amino acid adenylation, partial [Candidatus Thiomargarita nelsonii]
MFHVILGALYCYFVRTFHREDFVIGLPTLNRNNAAFKQTVGLFAGTSPALFRFGTDLSVVELVEKIRQELQKDYRHQRFPLGEIHRQVGLHSHQQLFDIMLSYAKHNYDVDFNGRSAKTVYTTAGFEQNALEFKMTRYQAQSKLLVLARAVWHNDFTPNLILLKEETALRRGAYLIDFFSRFPVMSDTRANQLRKQLGAVQK